MVRLKHKQGANPYLLKLRFKPWAKLWTVGSYRLFSPPRAGLIEKANISTGAVAQSLPLPGALKRRVLGKVSYLRREFAARAPAPTDLPEYFVLECYNPNPHPVALTLTVRCPQ